MGKRANAPATPATKSKKIKGDPVLASIAEVIMEADNLNDGCRAMLVDMLPFSLSFPEDTRHELQTMAVVMIEQTLSDKKSAMEAAVTAEEDKLSKLKASEVELGTAVTGAETALAAQKEVVDKAKTALAEATESARSSTVSLAALNAAKRDADAKLSATKDEKQTLESAFAAHFKTPMENQKGPNFKKLEPFLKKIEVEASLITALPSTCVKKQEERGSFDLLCLAELERAITSKITALGKVVDDEMPAAQAAEAAVQSAETDRDAKAEAEKQATTELEASLKEQSDREAALGAAKNAVNTFQPQVEEMIGMVSKAKTALEEFEAGPLAGFKTYKEKREAVVEVAPAGA